MSKPLPVHCSRVSSAWTWRDRLGAIKVRWGIGRMRYAVRPGLYSVGSPKPEAPVFVTANYKLSFDHLRRALRGLDGWILVLDTKAVNVWCAAGKGTFSTAEVVQRIREVQLDQVVSHRQLILPQLSAPGVNAFEVTRLSGFHVVYGPVYARDLPGFLAAGNTASPEMRRVHFRWHERLAVAPLELVIHFKRMLLAGLALALLSGLSPAGFSFTQAAARGGPVLLLWLAVYVLAGLLGPLLLPWLPARAFAIKGAWLGAALAAMSMLVIPSAWTMLRLTAWLILVIAGASFLLLNFTGATTFTSPSGVRREVRVALPAQAALGILGLAAWTLAGWNSL
ncbi:MAG TPA: acetyl-CoA synthase subunit gamma [Verrucomicrobia bacterium]|nr:MAG: hypothetical protein A2X46_08985 [Lentisphaerae bacterium GWF2_57_35]HBA82703.1 acetyl-CoA synthase subunit gamma [Verrucomicrobiota bacterium]